MKKNIITATSSDSPIVIVAINVYFIIKAWECTEKIRPKRR